MASNRGTTSLPRRSHATSMMRDFDCLPPELRIWVAQAMLPWSAASVRKAYRKAVARTGDKVLALKELDKLQKALVAKDAARVWDAGHPEARSARG